MSDYINYPLGTRVRLKNTGEEGEAFESAFGYISVFLDDDEGNMSIFKLDRIEFLEDE